MKFPIYIPKLYPAVICSFFLLICLSTFSQGNDIKEGAVVADQTVFSGSVPGNISMKKYKGSIIKWQRSTDINFTSPTDIADTGDVLTGTVIGPLTTDTYFRAVVRSDSSFHTTAPIAVNVEDLPAKLDFFTQNCNGKNVLLEWATSAEINNHHFIVERSTDAVSWYPIKTIGGSSNSHSVINYSFTDSTAKGRNNFYRLKSVDVKGQPFLSDIVNSYCGNAEVNFIISPNPGKDQFVISNLPANGMLRVTDNKGLAVWPVKVYGGSSYSFNLGNVRPGIYYLTVYYNGQTFTKQFIKE
jgi:hypothetical protein